MASKADLRIGIDIGSNAIKMVSHHPKKDAGLSRLALLDLIQEAKVHRPNDVDDTHILNGLHQLLNELPYKKASIRVCLSATMNNLFVVTIPHVGEQELKQALFWELGPLLPDPAKNYEFDYQVLSSDPKKKKRTVLIGVFKKDRLERILKVFNGLGKGIDILETDILSALDLFLEEFQKIEETIGFLQLGAAHSNYVVLSPESDPKFLFIPFGGNTLNNTIAGDMEVSFLEAENHRRKKEVDVHSALQNFADTIIRFNIHYFQKTGSTLNKIFVTGGLLNDSFVAHTLQSSPDFFQVPCEFWDPLKTHFPEEKIESQHQYHFASALGLVLR